MFSFIHTKSTLRKLKAIVKIKIHSRFQTRQEIEDYILFWDMTTCTGAADSSRMFEIFEL